MHALVTGANGFIGSHLVKYLAESGYVTRALILRGTGTDLISRIHPSYHNVEVIECDITDPASIRPWFHGQDYVFHLAGAIRGFSQAEFDRINVQGTKNVLAACKAMCPNLKRFVLFSSMGAAGPGTCESPQCEDDEPVPLCADYYGKSQLKAECCLADHAEGLPYTIIRPCTALGPGAMVELDLY